MTVNCPKCQADISDTYEPDDFSCGVVAGWNCDTCGIGVGEHEVDREPLEDDVGIAPAPRDRPLGTPISQLSGRPGQPGYEEFCRIARSWGYD